VHVAVSPYVKPGIAPQSVLTDAASRFPAMLPGDSLSGGYGRPPGQLMMPRCSGMPIPRYGAYMLMLPTYGRGTSDLQSGPLSVSSFPLLPSFEIPITPVVNTHDGG